MEAAWNDRQADPLFAPYPLARPITVDSLHGGQWQGMVCDRCVCAGYLELLPGDNPEELKARFRRDLLEILAGSGKDSGRVIVDFSETYGGHRTDPEHPLCRPCPDNHQVSGRIIDSRIAKLAAMDRLVGIQLRLRSGSARRPSANTDSRLGAWKLGSSPCGGRVYRMVVAAAGRRAPRQIRGTLVFPGVRFRGSL